MKILLTNDDGINGEGLLVLAQYAKTLGDVTIVAPKYEQSGKSQAIDIHNAFEVKKVDYHYGIEAYTVDSSPADCVRFADSGLYRKFDLVLSGINKGLNIGSDIVYSGTCGAIFEAEYLGIRSIAVSTVSSTFDSARKHLKRALDYVFDNDLFKYNLLYNINIPLDPKGIRITKQGGPYYKDKFVSAGENMYIASGYVAHIDRQDFTLDTDATLNGYISVSPMTVVRSDNAVYSKLISELK